MAEVPIAFLLVLLPFIFLLLLLFLSFPFPIVPSSCASPSCFDRLLGVDQEGLHPLLCILEDLSAERIRCGRGETAVGMVVPAGYVATPATRI